MWIGFANSWVFPGGTLFAGCARGASLAHRRLTCTLLGSVRGLAAVAIIFTTNADAQSLEAPARRIVSLNVCSDQLLMAVGDPGQIAGLSRFARDPDYSYDAVRARSWPALRGTAEEVLQLKPDLVLASSFTRPELRQALERFAIRTEVFEPATTIEDGRRDIARVARLTGNPQRADKLLAGIDKALAEARLHAKAWQESLDRAPSVLQFQRRAFVSGPKTLLGDILDQLGIVNAAEQLGIASVGRISLEALLQTAPDILLLDREAGHAADQGEAILRHPALRTMYRQSRRLVLPQQLVVCSGPSVPAAIRLLTRGINSLVEQRAIR